VGIDQKLQHQQPPQPDGTVLGLHLAAQGQAPARPNEVLRFSSSCAPPNGRAGQQRCDLRPYGVIHGKVCNLQSRSSMGSTCLLPVARWPAAAVDVPSAPARHPLTLLLFISF
jgi:hypothetical protein